MIGTIVLTGLVIFIFAYTICNFYVGFKYRNSDNNVTETNK